MLPTVAEQRSAAHGQAGQRTPAGQSARNGATCLAAATDVNLQETCLSKADGKAKDKVQLPVHYSRTEGK